MHVHTNALEVGFLIYVLLGAGLQVELLRISVLDIGYFWRQARSLRAREADGDYLSFCQDAIRVARFCRNKALVNLGIKLGGVVIGIWSILLPDSHSTLAVVYRISLTLFILVLIAKDDWVALQDWRRKRRTSDRTGNPGGARV